MSVRGQWVAVLAIVGILCAGVAVWMVLSPARGSVGVGTRAPEFEAVDLRTGEPVMFERRTGHVTLLNVWATWCTPCETEMPSMERLLGLLGDSGLQVLAVSVDVGSGGDVRDWVEERGLTFDVWHDPGGEIQRTYRTTGVPESFVIDHHGVIMRRVIGPKEWDHPSEVTLLRRLLAAAEDGDGSDRD